ncbi:MAG: hypothetical protein EOO50_10965 [Flavobacterium sp.]|uniref:hypothetical protein n=1 Tax=Flavobacterium sp. TaxID=239 RepID=UPI001209679F|nr:hypothetical protein [Flavobacterium sp.]RZJ66177.1 MAG: hypothetical protein EOO50_10965 [Flavobacterium sp.]
MYRLKNLILIFLLITLSSCGFAQSEFSIIGRWKLTEKHGNDGARDYVTQVQDGNIFIFEKNNVARDKSGNIGSYELDGKKLAITFKDGTRHYLVYHDNDPTKLSLNPVDENYGNICDEGCADIYRRI